MIIAVDAAGGEYAPHEVVKGAIKAAQDYDVGIALVGRKDMLHVQVGRYLKKLDISVVDATQTITDKESPVEAVTSKPDSSIIVGINLVKAGKAAAFVSAGNTGAVLYSSLLGLGRIEGIERPAIATIINVNITAPVLLIDSGANSNCRPKYLVQFARLGSIYSREVLGVTSPRVGLLNNGEEEGKGNKLMQETHNLLKETELNFVGNIEGHGIARGGADVVVTDGFTGNIVLKTLEGLGDTFLKLRNVGQVFANARHMQSRHQLFDTGLGSLVKRIDYRESGGACLLGVDGNVIISHGRSHAKAIRNAIGLAKQSADSAVCEKIKEQQSQLTPSQE
ncbi:MAG TPA: phosphate acyltransferase PlsX [Dehalococcoidia bacterium]|nr:phosphate acyltransferase PlsX [Dehalococcoidia bacterium]